MAGVAVPEYRLALDRRFSKGRVDGHLFPPGVPPRTGVDPPLPPTVASGSAQRGTETGQLDRARRLREHPGGPDLLPPGLRTVPHLDRSHVPLVNQLRPDWDAGRLSSRQLAERIAEQLGVDPNEVHDYMRELCTTVSFFPTINTAVRRRRARGSYLFRDDETFAADVLAGHLPVFTPEDLTPADRLTN